MPASANREGVAVLSGLLQHEVAAVEAYDQAIARLKGQYIDELKALRASHLVSISALSQRIRALDGGETRARIGPWPAFAKAVEGAAALLGSDPVIAALDQGEEDGLTAYRQAVDRLDPGSRGLVEAELLPAQERAQAKTGAIRRGRLHA